MGHLLLASKRLLMVIGGLYLVGLPNLGIQPQTRQQMGMSGVMPESPWTQSAYDMEQNATLIAHKELMDKMETHIDKTDDRVVSLGRELSDQEASSRVVDSLLGTIGVGALGLALTNLFVRIRRPNA